MMSDLPIDCGLPVVFVTIVYFVGGLEYTASQYFATAAAVVLFVLTAQSCGLFVGATVPLLKTAQTLTTMLNLCASFLHLLECNNWPCLLIANDDLLIVHMLSHPCNTVTWS